MQLLKGWIMQNEIPYAIGILVAFIFMIFAYKFGLYGVDETNSKQLGLDSKEVYKRAAQGIFYIIIFAIILGATAESLSMVIATLIVLGSPYLMGCYLAVGYIKNGIAAKQKAEAEVLKKNSEEVRKLTNKYRSDR